MTTTDSIDLFLTDLLKDKHGPDMPADELAEMKTELLPKLNTWITLKTLAELAKTDPNAVNDFKTWIQEKQPSQAQVQEHIAGKIPNAPLFLTQILLEFRNTYIGEQGV